MRYVSAVGLFVLALAASGCRASASASLNTGAKAQSEDESEPISEPRSEMAPASTEVALFGARHDLQLSADRKNPTCNCVAIVLGQPNDAGMKWEGPPPSIDPGTQLVIALSSECPAGNA